MMFRLFVILSLVVFASSFVFRGEIKAKQGFPKQCYFANERGDVTFFLSGTSAYDNKNCIKYDCEQGRKPGVLEITGYGCGTVGTSPPCYVTDIRPGQYPDCCPTVVCPDEQPTGNELPGYQQKI